MKEVTNLNDFREDNRIKPPAHLTKKQKDRFEELAEQLKQHRVMSVTDVDSLAMYITSLDMHDKMVKKLNSREVQEDPYSLEQYSKLQDRYFKQARASANDLGLTISSRHKMDIPASAKPKETKFSKFQKVGGQ